MRRYGDPLPAEAVERLEMELAVIAKMGFSGYFLIVWDFVKFAKDSGISVGPGRGSAAGSLVSYALNITEVDPLAYDLLFERFLNAERVSMPDIDIDFSVKGRDRVMRYVADKYGRDCVAQIVTFGRMFPRAATRDAARVLDFDYGTGDRLAKLIPDPIMGRPPSFEDCLKPGEDLARAVAEDPQAKQIVEVAQGLEGIVRNSSIHAAAVVIAPEPLTNIVPLQLAEDTGKVDEDGNKLLRTVTQYSMKPIEELGLLKMDFLGLRNLDVIEAALDIIEQSTGERPDMATLPLDDPKTYEMLSAGHSVGVFQFESDGMRDALRKVKPTEFEDLVALVALYRPGAMRHIDTYARNKRQPDGVTYIDERLRSITESTYSVILYQEQSMQIAKAIAGFSGPEADDLRKAIGKKDRKKMAGMRDRFFEGARSTGTPDRVTDELWGVNEAAADYSLQPLARRVLRADRLPDRVAQGELPGRVHGRADLVGHVHEGQGAVLRLALRGDGHRGAAAGRERVRPRLRRDRREHPLRARGGEGRGRRRGGRDHRRARVGRPVHVDLGLLRARGLPRREQAGGRVPRQVGRVRLARRLARGNARGAAAGAGRRREGAAGRAARPGLDLRRPGAGSRAAAPARSASSTRRFRRSPTTASS